jgi:DNA mismatch repair protein MutS
VKYNGIFGFFIEVSKLQSSKVPTNFITKQTLVNATRYTTTELGKFEQKFLEAEEKKNNLEYEIFQKIRGKVLENFSIIKDFASFVANIDFLTSLAQVSYENAYTKPEIIKNYDLKILG